MDGEGESKIEFMSFRKLIWLFPLATTLHNFEEAVTVVSWQQTAEVSYPPVGPPEFHITLVILTIAAIVITWRARTARKKSVPIYIFAAYSVSMLLNVFFPHLLGTLYFGKYIPGVITAVLLNLPVNSYLLRVALKEGFITLKSLIRWTALVAPLIIAFIRASFWTLSYLRNCSQLKSLEPGT